MANETGVRFISCKRRRKHSIFCIQNWWYLHIVNLHWQPNPRCRVFWIPSRHDVPSCIGNCWNQSMRVSTFYSINLTKLKKQIQRIRFALTVPPRYRFPFRFFPSSGSVAWWMFRWFSFCRSRSIHRNLLRAVFSVENQTVPVRSLGHPSWKCTTAQWIAAVALHVDYPCIRPPIQRQILMWSNKTCRLCLWFHEGLNHRPVMHWNNFFFQNSVNQISWNKIANYLHQPALLQLRAANLQTIFVRCSSIASQCRYFWMVFFSLPHSKCIESWHFSWHAFRQPVLAMYRTHTFLLRFWFVFFRKKINRSDWITTVSVQMWTQIESAFQSQWQKHKTMYGRFDDSRSKCMCVCDC